MLKFLMIACLCEAYLSKKICKRNIHLASGEMDDELKWDKIEEKSRTSTTSACYVQCKDILQRTGILSREKVDIPEGIQGLDTPVDSGNIGLLIFTVNPPAGKMYRPGRMAANWPTSSIGRAADS